MTVLSGPKEHTVEYGAAAGTVPELRYDVAVVDPDPRVRLWLGVQVVGSQQFEAVEDLAQSLRPGRPTVAVFGPGFVNPYGFQQVHRLTGIYPELGPIFAAQELTTEVLTLAVRAGARDAVQIEEHGDALAQSVARVAALLHTIAAPPNRAPGTPGAAAGLHRATPGHLIAVFSTKGGVGKSTIATNVGVLLAKKVDDGVTLADGDLQFGDVSVLLGLPPQHTIVDAAASVEYADPDLMSNIVARHESGLMVLPAPTEPALSSGVTPDEMVGVCRALQAMSGWVLVDLPTTFDDTTLGVLEVADEVLLVASMDIPSIKNLKIGMQALDLMAIAGPKLRLVLNRSNAQVKLDIREIEHVLGLRANFPIPYDIAVPMSANAGQPVVLYEPRSAASRALERIANALLGETSGLPGRGNGRRRGRQKRQG